MNKDGVVLVNFDRCIGCYACCIACPYDARFPYENEDVNKGHELYGKTVTHDMPHVDKCTFCAHRLAENREPACVSTCPTHTRIFGDLDDSSSEVHKLAASGKAQVLNPGLGTSPKVFYIPS
jgi:Fe-S-cluster-containing dehydrogenase component